MMNIPDYLEKLVQVAVKQRWTGSAIDAAISAGNEYCFNEVMSVLRGTALDKVTLKIIEIELKTKVFSNAKLTGVPPTDAKEEE